MALAVLLVLRPLHEMVDGLGEDAALDAGAGLLRGGVVHLFEHAGHAEQVGRLEAAQVGEQVLGAGDVADHAVRADRHVLDVAREAVGQRQEQQQAARLVEHVVEDLVTVEHGMGEVAVREHRALGLAGGAGRVDDRGHVVGLHARDGAVELLVGDGLDEVGHRVQARGLEVEHVLEPVAPVADPVEGLGVRGVPRERDHRVDVVDDAGRLLGRVGLVDRHADRADGGAGEVHDAPFVTGRGVDHHHAAGLDAQADQPLRYLAHALLHLAGRHVVPLARLVVLPLRDQIVRIPADAVDEQRVNGVFLGGGADRGHTIFTQHSFIL